MIQELIPVRDAVVSRVCDSKMSFRLSSNTLNSHRYQSPIIMFFFFTFAMAILVCSTASANVITIYGGLNARAISETWGGYPQLNDTITNAVDRLSYKHSQDYYADTKWYQSTELYDHDQSQVISEIINGDMGDNWFYSITAHAETGNDESGHVQLFKIDRSMFDSKTEFITKKNLMPLVANISLKGTGFVTESHPSEVKWMPIYDAGKSVGGYIFVAEEYRQKAVLVIPWNKADENENKPERDIPSNSQLILPKNPISVSNVWLFRRDGFVYVVSLGNNQGIGEVRRATPGDLFSYFGATDGRVTGILNTEALRYVHTFQTCGGWSFAANSMVIQDAEGEWYIVKEYGTRDSSGEVKENFVAVYHILFNGGEVILDCDRGEVINKSFSRIPFTFWGTCLLSDWGYCAPNAEGASGFRVTRNGDLTFLEGASFSYLPTLSSNWKSWMREVRSK